MGYEITHSISIFASNYRVLNSQLRLGIDATTPPSDIPITAWTTYLEYMGFVDKVLRRSCAAFHMNIRALGT